MIEYTCNDCKKKFISGSNARIFDTNLLFYYCNICIKNHKLYSKTTVLRKFCLKKSLLVNLKKLYIPNKCNIQSYYLQSDILATLNFAYNNIDDYLQIIKLKQKKLKIRRDAKNLAVKTRREKLIEAFNNNKLEFNCVGDCYAYINYGEPSIETIISNEIIKLEEQNERRKMLAEFLRNSKILLDNKIESIPLVDNYIKYSQGNIRNVVNVVKRIIEDKLKMQNSTNNINNNNNTKLSTITWNVKNKINVQNRTMIVSFD